MSQPTKQSLDAKASNMEYLWGLPRSVAAMHARQNELQKPWAAYSGC